MIIRQFPERDSLVFGSGFVSQAYYLSRALKRLGVEVHVLTERKNKPTTDIMNGIIVHRFPKFFTTAGVIGCLGYNFSEWKWIRRFLEKYNINIIHSHAPTTGVAWLRSKKILGQPLVATFHGTAAGEANAIDLQRGFTLKNLLNKYVNFRLQGLVDQYTCKKADKVTTVSKTTALKTPLNTKFLWRRLRLFPMELTLNDLAEEVPSCGRNWNLAMILLFSMLEDLFTQKE